MQLVEQSADPEPLLTRDLLTAARPVAGTACDWQVRASGTTLTFRPFMEIGAEPYRMHQDVLPVRRGPGG
jgi:hypothetical protein